MPDSPSCCISLHPRCWTLSSAKMKSLRIPVARGKAAASNGGIAFGKGVRLETNGPSLELHSIGFLSHKIGVMGNGL